MFVSGSSVPAQLGLEQNASRYLSTSAPHLFRTRCLASKYV